MKIVVFDLDGTIVPEDTFVNFLVKCLSTYPTRLASCLHLPFAVVMHYLGIRDNTWLKKVFLRSIVGGLNRRQIGEIASNFIDNSVMNHTKPLALEAIAEHRKAGHTLVLASASPDLYVTELGAKLGFDHVIATKIAWRSIQSPNGCVTSTHDQQICSGEIEGENCYGQNKIARLKQDVSGVESDYYAAYSDHHSDLPLLEMAHRGYAVDATVSLQRLANERRLDLLAWKR